jgi:hypothetical protein
MHSVLSIHLQTADDAFLDVVHKLHERVFTCKMSYGIYGAHVTNRTVFNVYGPVHRNNILIHIQQDATLRSLFYLETALYVSGGITTHHQEGKQLYLQHLVFATPLLLPVASGR